MLSNFTQYNCTDKGNLDNVINFRKKLQNDDIAKVKFISGIFISVIAILLNAICLRIKVKKRNNYLISSHSSISISLAYIFYSLLSMPINTIYSIYRVEEYTPIQGIKCTAWYVIDFSLYGTITIFMIVLAYNQYRSLNKPFTFTNHNHFWTKNYIKKAVFNKYFLITIAIWLGPFSCWFTTAIIYRASTADDCGCFFYSVAYNTATGCLAFALPMSMLFVITMFIIHSIRRRNISMSCEITVAKTRFNNRVGTLYIDFDTVRNRRRTLSSHRVLVRDKKALYFLLCNEITFIALWLPYICVPFFTPERQINYYYYWLAYFNAIVYPTLYLIFK